MAVPQKEKEAYEKVPTEELLVDHAEKTQEPLSYGYGIRHVQSLILFICMSIGYVARAHLGVTVVAMISTPDQIDTNYSYSEPIDDSIWNVYRTYDWPKNIQEMILGAFFLGYCVMMFPTGMVCQRYGGKLPLQVCLLVNGLVSLATPTVAVWGGWKAVCGCRVIQGMSQSGLYPSAHTLLAKWVPISERATLSSYVYTGTMLGTVLAFQMSGLMANSSLGWPGTFWLTGALCLASFAMLSIFGTDSPSEHKFITEAEKNYIMGQIDVAVKKRAKTPWAKIFTSRHVLASFLTHMAAGICFVFLFTQIPSYMHFILKFDVKNSGIFSSLPYIACAFATTGYGILSDYCINKGYLSMRAARILCNSIAQFGTALCLVAVPFTEDRIVAVILLTVALGLFAGIHSGWMVNYIDLAPNFSGSLMATGNTISTLGIIATPFFISNIITDVTNQYQWRIVIFVMAGLISFCSTIFVFFMSADSQPWNNVEAHEEEAKNETLYEKC